MVPAPLRRTAAAVVVVGVAAAAAAAAVAVGVAAAAAAVVAVAGPTVAAAIAQVKRGSAACLPYPRQTVVVADSAVVGTTPPSPSSEAVLALVPGSPREAPSAGAVVVHLAGIGVLHVASVGPFLDAARCSVAVAWRGVAGSASALVGGCLRGAKLVELRWVPPSSADCAVA